MSQSVLHLHPDDSVLVALTDLPAQQPVDSGCTTLLTAEAIPAKHKLSRHNLSPGDPITMYGVLVGRAKQAIPAGGRLTFFNVKEST